MSGARVYRSTYHRPAVAPPNRSAETPTETRRSNAAIPVVVVLVVAGFYLSRYTVLLTGLLGLVLLFSGTSFLSTRINPLSPHFYLTRKPSWLAIGVVFLGAFGLFAGAWELYIHGLAPVFPNL